ncbi:MULTISPECIES: glycosyltransferase [Chryseobacterium]|uniref:Glycosyltransferase involved in cell wall biosynthesis n=1 Tax=Chryseobacterium geocarposphaerae TaxID=1416776 RepID=A0ABU1LDH7_9FLAO|nr:MULTISPECIES: glycosyltransferase [Chryseobacterium]MDR6404754.1 glycosyltransferase involved in cell wall biosynthesis [Chryseobacterium geocarposphaerae]MDR6698013.1 glycosyltransferase involved in cell wall biosynthesis [Chryseobacterium ginsenosidimutans]
MENKRVLLISYDFPPIGGGGVQRNVKYMKYLSRLGWDTNVLTIKERDFYVYDYSLLDEIKQTTIHKADSLDPISIVYKIKKIFKKEKPDDGKEAPGVDESAWYVSVYRFIRDWFMFPDGFGGWIPLAYKKGLEVISNNKPDILLATFPHPTNAILTYFLHKKSKIPYVIDFRDAWLDDPYVSFPSFVHRKIHGFWERKIILGAGRVIVYGTPLKDILEKKYPKLKGNIDVITNGFDPEDFDKVIPVHKNNKIRIVYSGAVYVDRRETYVNFIEAFSQLPQEIINQFEIVFVGDKLKWATKLIQEKNLTEHISFTGYLQHSEALNYLASADIALMFLKAGDKVALTGKIFEYLGLGVPVFACVEEDGACADMLKSINHDQYVVSPTNIYKMKEIFLNLIHREFKKVDYESVKIYSRKYHAACLNDVLESVVLKK